jgi:hypothetical protein
VLFRIRAKNVGSVMKRFAFIVHGVGGCLILRSLAHEVYCGLPSFLKCDWGGGVITLQVQGCVFVVAVLVYPSRLEF